MAKKKKYSKRNRSSSRSSRSSRGSRRNRSMRSRFFKRLRNVASGKNDKLINQLRNQLNSINNENIQLKSNINGPLYIKEGLTTVNEPTENKSYPYADPNDSLITYDASSGLIQSNSAYNTLYKNYYNAFQYDESTIKNVLRPEIQYLKQTELTGFDFTFESIKNQNNVLENQIKNNITSYSTDNTKIAFQSEDLSRLKKINNILFGIYFLAVFALIYILLLVKKSLSIYLKIFIIAIAIIHPFLVDKEVQFIKYCLRYFTSIINGNVYVSRNYTK
jgi:hypothetical protein